MFVPQICVATDAAAFTSLKCESQLVMLHLNLCTAGLVSKHPNIFYCQYSLTYKVDDDDRGHMADRVLLFENMGYLFCFF